MNNNFYQIKIGYYGKEHWELYHVFYINKSKCDEIYVDDLISKRIITLEQWRNNKNKSKNKMNTRGILFSNVFNEGSNIKFTPSELDELSKKEIKVRELQEKLKFLENQKLTSDDFSVDDLSILINNETFSNSETYIDSSWLDYILNKYKIDHDKLHQLVLIAIEQEDLNAINIILSNNYVPSFEDLKTVEKRKLYSEEMIKMNYNNRENKTDEFTFYDENCSTIKQIEIVLKNKYLLNYISDRDGYVNLRKEQNIQSEVIQQIKTGEKIEVLDNQGKWWLIKTKDGKQGYVYYDRIKAN